MICFRQPDLLILLSIITASEAIGDFGIDCRKDSECTRSDPNLRCYSKPGLADFGDKRCRCKYKWKFQSGLCRPPNGWKPDKKEEALDEASEADYLVVLMPSLLLASVTLVISLCCCYYVHSGNRELHRELKQYNRKQVVIDKYLVGDQETGIQVNTNRKNEHAKPSHTIVTKEESSDSDSGLFEMADLGRVNAIGSDGFFDDRQLVVNTDKDNLKTSQSSSVLSVRSLDQRRQNLHPLNGLVQPTGLLPQGGYQANMRLLFNQRPVSAISHGAASNSFLLKSRPASAISRFSTASRPESAFTKTNYEESTDDEVFSDREQQRISSPEQISNQIYTVQKDVQAPQFKKSKYGPFKNGPKKQNGINKNGATINRPVQTIIKRNGTSNQKPVNGYACKSHQTPKETVSKLALRSDSKSPSAAKSGSQSISSSKAVAFRPKTKPSRSSVSSGSSGTSRPSSCTTETVMEKIIRLV